MQGATVSKKNLTHLEIVCHKCHPNEFGVKDERLIYLLSHITSQLLLVYRVRWAAEKLSVWKLPKHWKKHGNRERNYNSRLVNNGCFKMYLRRPNLSESRLGLDLFILTFKTIGQNHIHSRWDSSGCLSKLKTVSEPCNLWGVTVSVPLGASDIWQLLLKKPVCSG